MLYIKKGPPKESIAQKTAEIKRRDSWKSLPDNVPENGEEAAKYTNTLRSMFEEFRKTDIRETVIHEQHGLCCYCMRRIANDGENMRIEHWYPLKMNKRTAIEYQNFLGACTGVCSDHYSEFQCCDNSKSGNVIEIDPRNQSMMDQIMYKSDGEVYFEQSSAWTEAQVLKFQNEINNILRLNGSSSKNKAGDKINISNEGLSYSSGNELKSRREAVYKACVDEIRRIQKKKLPQKISIMDVQKLVDKIESSDEYPEYAGVMLFYYKRWIRNHQKRT